MSFYLDTLRAETGAVRIIPGSNFLHSDYTKALHDNLFQAPRGIREAFGVEADEIPSYVIDNDPGDLLVWDFRTFHASFHGGDRRRSFSLVWKDTTQSAGA
jgi:ectoine hydroxylase-related dioxygenase (phytanoyl-CoA dioxygenase family)